MKILFFVVFFGMMLAFPIVIMQVTNHLLVSSGKMKSKKNCTCKTTATITKISDAGFLDPDTGRGKETEAWYEFYVNGVKYSGIDYIFDLPFNNQTVTVLYDPKDPNNNCTKFGKGRDNGSNYVKAVLITVGIIAAIVLFFSFVAALLGAGRR